MGAILIVDDEKNIRESLAMYMQSLGHTVETAADAETALDEYFQPRPSAVSYAAEASGPSNLSSSNYALRARVASMLGPIVKYQSGAKAGQPVAPDMRRRYGGT